LLVGDKVNLTKRVRRRRQKDGRVVEQLRYVVNYQEPRTGKRRQEFFERQKEAQARQAELQSQLHSGNYFDARRAPTIAAAVDHYLAERSGKVKASTLEGYRVVVQHIKGPLLVGSAKQRAEYSRSGQKPDGTKLVQALGNVKVSELTTAEIRQWHRTVAEISGDYTANRAASHLKAISALAEEDFRVRGPAMPRNLARSRQKQRKEILTPAQVGALLSHAQKDLDRGVYCIFPYLSGCRPSEQLGLLWQEVDFEANVIHIRRMLERDGTLAEMTKTPAGMRAVPMALILREMLLEWRVRCPRFRGQLHFVFPAPGRRQIWPMPRAGGGGPLLYWNFLKRFWKPAFVEAELPYVTPHSARHSFISTMQAQGVEVGLVAKLAGHANPTVTLGHYTQAVRGGEEAVKALEAAYTAQQAFR
jgi:integrase